MIKRASTILLTLFLLLTSAQVWAQYVTGITVAETSFETKTGTYPCKINEIKCKNPSNESYSTSLQYVARDPSSNGTYSINNGTLSIKHNQTGDSNVLLAGNIGGLVSAAGYNNYKIYIKLASGGDFQVRCQTYYNNNDHNQVDRGPGNTIEIDATCVGGSVSFSLFFNWVNSGTLKIESIKVIGASEKKVISSESPAVCSGKETTLSGLGSTSTSYQWYVSDNNSNYTPIAGATQSTYTVAVTEKKWYKLNDLPGTCVYPVVCCSDNTVGSNISETFPLASTANFGSLPNGQIDNAYGHASSSPIGDGKYSIVHKAKDGGHWDNSPVESQGSNDGFLLVNCSPSDHGKAMYKREFDRLCPNTLYKFSASVANIDMKTSDIGIDVKFDVIAKEGSKNGQSLLPEPISVSVACGNSSWIEKSISFVTSSCRKVEVRLYNNVENPTGKGGNDVGIDNIIFGLCTPEIALYSNEGWTEKDREICPDEEPDTYINVGSAMNLNEIFPNDKYYYYEYQDGNTWKPVPGTNPTTSSKIKVTLDEATHSAGVLYRAWIAGDATTVVDAAKGRIAAGSCTSYAQSDAITLTYKCANPCTETSAPSVIVYDQCPITGTKTYYSLLQNPITTDQDNYEWEKYNADGTTTTPITATTFDTNEPNNTGKYRVRSKKFTDNNGIVHCLSPWKDFNITISESTGIKLIVDGTEYGPSSTYTICAGKEVILKTSYSPNPTNSEFVKWEEEVDGTTLVRTENTSSITVRPEETTKYTATIVNSCKLPGSITINVISLEKPVIGVDKNTICKEDKVNMGVSYVEEEPTVPPTVESETTAPDNIEAPIVSARNSTTITYTWYFNENNVSNISSWTIISEGNADLLNYKPEKTGYYKLKANIGECAEISDAIKVTVGNPITFTTSEPTTICEDDNTTVSVTNITPSTANVQWYDEEGNKIGNEDGLLSVNVSPTKTTTYKVSLWIEGGCESNSSVKITVDKQIDATINTPDPICYGESTSLSVSGGERYKWTPTRYLSNSNIANPSVTKPEETTEYTVKIYKGKCDSELKTTVTVNPLPVINTINVQTSEEGQRELTVNVTDGESPYKYSLDGENYDILDVILERVSIGWNMLYVIDANECGTSEMFEVEPLPIFPDKYFSPNGDGVHDRWLVRNLDTYSSYIVEIFDRHGKRLFIQRVGSFNIDGVDDGLGDVFTGWTGEYNGKAMPSDDYWYLITVEDIRKQYTGHFTLKR